MTIRVAGPADALALVRLASAFRDHLRRTTPSEAAFRASIEMLLGDGQTEFALAVEPPATAVGYVQSRYRHSAWTSGLDAELEDLFVIEGARRRGVGARLAAFAIQRATERGCRVIALNTNERNSGAVGLYYRLGFAAERASWNGGRQLWLEKWLAAT